MTPEDLEKVATEFAKIHFNQIHNLQETTLIETFISGFIIGHKYKIVHSESPHFIKNYPMSTRLSNCLEYNSLKTLEAVAALPRRELFKIKRFGKKSFYELINIMLELNIEYNPSWIDCRPYSIELS